MSSRRLLSAALLALAPGAMLRASERPPNIVLILTDDQGYADVGVYGAKGFATPNLDRLATEGCRLTNFHVAQATCSPSRAALLTGCYPNRLGINKALGTRLDYGLNPEEMTLPRLLKSRGYATGMAGKWHLGDNERFSPPHYGFDESFGLPYSNDMWPLHPSGPSAYPPLPLIENGKVVRSGITPDDQAQLTTWYTERAVSFIERNKDRPFFFYLAHSMPHVPLYVSSKFKGKSQQGLYGDVIMEIDWSVGEVMRALARNGLERDTIVLFLSDNGPWLSYGNHAGSAGPFREGKGTSWEGGTRVPFILRWPGRVPAGTTSNDFVLSIDLFPTLAQLAGAGSPAREIDGLDIWPLLSRQPGARNPHAYYGFWYAKNELQSVVSGDGRWKLVLPHDYATLAGRPGGANGTPAKYETGRVRSAELYDLDADPGEHRDLAATQPVVLKHMLDGAEQCRAELGDSLTHRTGRGTRQPGRVGGKKS